MHLHSIETEVYVRRLARERDVARYEREHRLGLYRADLPRLGRPGPRAVLARWMVGVALRLDRHAAERFAAPRLERATGR